MRAQRQRQARHVLQKGAVRVRPHSAPGALQRVCPQQPGLPRLPRRQPVSRWAPQSAALAATALRAHLCEADACGPASGYELPHRVSTQWMDVGPALFALLRMAVYNPVNAFFVLLSESCLPLYPAAVVYLQLVHGRKSRIDGAQPAPRQAPCAALRLRLPHLPMLYA